MFVFLTTSCLPLTPSLGRSRLKRSKFILSILLIDQLYRKLKAPNMMSAFSSLVSESSELILCFYTNCTNKIQILRVNSNQNLSFERIVFPGQRLLFKALPDAQLEIHTNQKENLTEDLTLVEAFSCAHLRVHEEMSA